MIRRGYDPGMTGKKSRFALLLLPLIAVGCASQPNARMPAIPQSANPSAVIAAEIAFNRTAQEKGQWTAFREFAAKEAYMFVPEPVFAQEWLKGRADPAKSVVWQPHKTYMSCDGKTGVTTGAWQRPDGAVGYFTTVWNWYPKGRVDPNAPVSAMGAGEWKWLVDHGDALSKARAVPEMIETRVASCKGRANAPLSAPAVGAKMKMGFSRDQSLNFTWVVNADNSRVVTVNLWNGTGFDEVLRDTVAAPAKP